jgi:hypothetical protein
MRTMPEQTALTAPAIPMPSDARFVDVGYAWTARKIEA